MFESRNKEERWRHQFESRSKEERWRHLFESRSKEERWRHSLSHRMQWPSLIQINQDLPEVNVPVVPKDCVIG